MSWFLPIAMGLGAAGSVMGAKDGADRALATARARNAVLSDSLGRIDKNAAENRATFDARLGDYATAPQALETAQTTRANNNVSNITAGNADEIALSGSAPAAVRGAIAERLQQSFGGAKDRAVASGRLGGYGDAWLGNKIGIADSANRIGTVNNFSQGQARILPALQDFAEQAAYKPPAILPQIMRFAGNILGSAAGSGMLNGMGGMFGGPAANAGVAGGGYLGSGGVVYPGPGRY